MAKTTQLIMYLIIHRSHVVKGLEWRRLQTNTPPTVLHGCQSLLIPPPYPIVEQYFGYSIPKQIDNLICDY